MDSRYLSWQKFCAESDRQVSDFNSKQQKRCPFCRGEANMYWKSMDYDNFFIVECKNCEARVKAYSFDEAVKLWNNRAVDENAMAIIKELADALDGSWNGGACECCATLGCPGVEKCPDTKDTVALVAKAREVMVQ